MASNAERPPSLCLPKYWEYRRVLPCLPLQRKKWRVKWKERKNRGEKELFYSCLSNWVLLVAGCFHTFCLVIYFVFFNDSWGQTGHHLKDYETSGRILTLIAELVSDFSWFPLLPQLNVCSKNFYNVAVFIAFILKSVTSKYHSMTFWYDFGGKT